MASQPLSVGNILMLSQTAGKVGRAFTQGKKSAPSEFAEVERESNGLSEALKLVAETLHDNGSVLSQAEPQTRAAVSTILESASKTLSDLESFVERHQVIKKQETKGGFVVERSWSDVVLANYRTLKWTTEGGDMTELRNMLHMHTSTINRTMQALQSRSLSGLKRTVMPMAEHVADVHDRVTDELTDQIDDLHRVILAVANSTPSLQARDRAIRDADSVRNTSITVSTVQDIHAPSRQLELPPPRERNRVGPSIRHAGRRASEQSNHSGSANAIPQASREDSAYDSTRSMEPLRTAKDVRQMDWDFESGSPPRTAEYEFDASPGSSSYYGSQSRRESSLARRDSTTLPSLFSAIDEAEAEVQAGAYAYDIAPGGDHDDVEHDDGYFTGTSLSASLPPMSVNAATRSPGPSPLPPPALPLKLRENAPATPASLFARPRSPERSQNAPKEQTDPSTSPKDSTRSDATSERTRSTRKAKEPYSPEAVAADSPSFEKGLFRNSAILCDVRASLVEYAVTIPDEPDPRFSTEMKPACKEARICVVRKRENRDISGTRVVTSVWTLSDDGATKMQLRLSDINETVPFASYFDPCKISIPATEDDLTLRFHTPRYGDEVKDEKKTNWINYVFAREADSVSFQSAICGRMLLSSYRTTKTTVIHEGFKGTFTFEEQFANIEMCRLFEDDGVATPGGAGGVLILMHISSNFGEGWARFWINSSRQHVRVKEDGTKYAKVKGIDLLVVKPGGEASIPGKVTPEAEAHLCRADTGSLLDVRPTGGERIPIRKVKGIRIEFQTEDERDRFVAACRKAQERMIPLPDL
ncbi:hypothetical protein EJ03DRAFT_347523 [Teratosphaeria nubilosa]|uniref:Uncharacterized protein n=1 Tax=Teratosphaeria nubilosa TaxID=161662 RepID=A0A6G1LLV6_9PEZI|nr:hypothetical protein EJ03DRAFT_347523 [Teratosphaeria nubilosa]